MAEQNSAAKQNNEKNSHSQGEPQKNEAGIGSVLSIIFVAALAAVLFGTVIYSLDRRNTVYSKVSSLTNELTYAKAENVIPVDMRAAFAPEKDKMDKLTLDLFRYICTKQDRDETIITQ